MKESKDKILLKKAEELISPTFLREKLVASEVRYRRLFESAKDGILILEADTGKIIDVNPFLIKLLGFSKAAFIGKEIWELGFFKDIAANKEKFLELQYREYVRYENLPLETYDGRKINVEFVSNVYLENSRKIVQCNVRDITERKKAELKLSESERKFRSFFENSMDAILLTGNDDEILSVNKAACNLFGYTDNEITKLGLSMIENSTDSRIAVLMTERAVSGKVKGEVTFIKKDGTCFPAEISASVFKNIDGEFLAGMTIHDISERKQIEKQLLQAKEDAEQSDHLKTAFLANMSHEIRTPMNGILGFTGLLKEPMLTGEEQKEYIDIIEKSGLRMLNIINDIISISKIESGEIDINVSSFNTNELIKDIYDTFSLEAKQKNIRLTYTFGLSENESEINTDREKVYAILTNLVKNAIKFTNTGSIDVGYLMDNGELKFFVRDTGIGVEQDRIKIIFERFRQGSELLIRNYEGAGLGLSISKGYVMMLGGRIWVEKNRISSATNQNGSVFYFTVPLLHPEGKSTAHESIKLNPKEDLKILIVEDDPVSEMLLSLVARQISKHILKVQTGLEAIKACRCYPDINLILMDIKMPEMDGYEATRQIRKFNKEVIIIAQTAFALTGDRQKALDAGCNDYITKPVNSELLNSMVIKYLN